MSALRDLRRFFAFITAGVALGALGVFAGLWYALMGVR